MVACQVGAASERPQAGRRSRLPRCCQQHPRWVACTSLPQQAQPPLSRPRGCGACNRPRSAAAHGPGAGAVWACIRPTRRASCDSPSIGSAAAAAAVAAAAAGCSCGGWLWASAVAAGAGAQQGQQPGLEVRQVEVVGDGDEPCGRGGGREGAAEDQGLAQRSNRAQIVPGGSPSQPAANPTGSSAERGPCACRSAPRRAPHPSPTVRSSRRWPARRQRGPPLQPGWQEPHPAAAAPRSAPCPAGQAGQTVRGMRRGEHAGGLPATRDGLFPLAALP